MIVIEYDHDTVDRETKKAASQHHVLRPMSDEREVKSTIENLRKNKRVSNVTKRTVE